MEMQSTFFNSRDKYKALQRVMLLVLVLLMVLLTGCAKAVKTDEVTIFAASSLSNAVSDIEQAFERDNEQVTLRTNFAGSKTLRSQLENGAQADVFLSANEEHYLALLDQGVLIEGKKLVTNEMVLVLSIEGAKEIKSLEDLQGPHRLILGDEGVPAGDYSREIIGKLGTLYGKAYESNVLSNLVSSESNVRQVLMKIVLGEGDAAIVYRTDISADIKDKVTVIDIPTDYNVTANYWMGVVNNDMISESVRSYCQFLLADKSDEIFEKYGFCITE